MNKKIKIIEDYVRKNTSNNIAHDFKHVDRVRKWALIIAKKENYPNLEIMEATALLHDVGRGKTAKEQLHGQVGAKIAADFLRKNKLFDDKEIRLIEQAIAHHSYAYRAKGRLDALLYDADKLDLFGAIGVMRSFTSKYFMSDYDPKLVKGKSWQKPLDYFEKRFSRGLGEGDFIADQLNFQISCLSGLKTETARKIAKPLAKYMSDFLRQLEKEIKHQI